MEATYQPWGQPSLLYNGHWVIPEGKATGAWVLLTTPFGSEFKERVQLCLCSPSVPSWNVIQQYFQRNLLFINNLVLYGCETRSLTLREERRLRVFDIRVLRGTFGPKRDEVTGG